MALYTSPWSQGAAPGLHCIMLVAVFSSALSVGRGATRGHSFKLRARLASEAPHQEEVGAGVAARPGVDKQRRLIYFAHFHGSGGSSLCAFARRATENKSSGVLLGSRQLEKSACNLWDWKRGGEVPIFPLQSCSNLPALASYAHSSWMFVETALDVKPPCSGVAFIAAFREPWDRMKALLFQRKGAVSRALRAVRLMRPGDSIISPDSPANWIGWPPSVYDPSFQIGYFDNFHVRFLLGTREGRQVPWGKLTEEHLQRAKKTLDAFDLVVPTELLSIALQQFQMAVGSHFDFGLDAGGPGGRYEFASRSNTHERKRKPTNDLAELETFFRKQNALDLRLYSWVSKKWQNVAKMPL